MKKISLIFAIFPLLMTSCFQLDNYDAPDAGIDGTLIDIETDLRFTPNSRMAAVLN